MNRLRARQRGLTMVELLVGTAVLVGGGGALLIGMQYAMAHSDYLRDFQLAMNATQGRLEELSATDFDALWTGNQFAAARTAAGQCIGLNEDRNCNGQLDAGEDLNANNVLDEPLPGGRLWMKVQRSIPGPQEPTLLDLVVSACWATRGRRVGEDTNCNGQLNAGEDANGNGLLDSPVMASTRVAMSN